MLSGHVKINEFQIIEYQAENNGTNEDGLTVWECVAGGRDNRGNLYEHDFQVIDEGLTGAALVGRIMEELDERLRA